MFYFMLFCLLKLLCLDWLGNKIVLLVSEIQPQHEKISMSGLFFLGSFIKHLEAVWIIKSHINYSSHILFVLTDREWGQKGYFTAWGYAYHSQEPGSHSPGHLAQLWAWATLYPLLGNRKGTSVSVQVYSTLIPVEGDVVFLGWWKCMERTSAITFPRK